MPPIYVKPYVKRGKTDATDVEVLVEKVSRPTMRFAAVMSVDQQAVLLMNKVRELLGRQRTMLIDAPRGHMAEFGMVAVQRPIGVKAVIDRFRAEQDSLPPLARSAIRRLVDQIKEVGAE